MTGKSWKAPEIIKVLEFINENFSLWCKHRKNACTKVAKAHKLDRDATSIYSMVNNLLQAIKTPKRRKACKILRKRRISSLVREINKKTADLDEGLNTNMTTNANQVATTSASQAATTSASQATTTSASQISATFASQAATTSASQIAATFASQAATTSASQIAATFASQAATTSASQIAATFASQAATTSASQINDPPQQINENLRSVIRDVEDSIKDVEDACEEKVKQVKAKHKEEIEQYNQFKNDIINTIKLKRYQDRFGL